MAKAIKKVDPKKVNKVEVNGLICKALLGAGVSFSNGADFGMTEGTIIVHMASCDVQVKLITPKAGVDRYERAEEE